MVVPIPLSDVMSTTVETIGPEASSREAAQALDSASVGSVVVVDAGEVVGMVTSADLVECLAAGDGDTSVRAVMSHPVFTASPSTEVGDAARRMRDENIKKLPVCDGGNLVGIVTVTDLAYYTPPLLVRSRPRLDEDRPVFTDPDTAYELPDWEFESHGTANGIDVGDAVTFAKTITEEDVELFGEISGDTNRVHLDPEFAADTRFGRQIAHGSLVGSAISAALARLPGVIIYLSQQLRYTAPVDLDERVTARCEVVEDLGGGRFRLATDVEGEDGETVIEGEAMVLAEPHGGE
ncbi:MAG: CBS domain-containing protein [Haloarculaceae archaeon]